MRAWVGCKIGLDHSANHPPFKTKQGKKGCSMFYDAFIHIFLHLIYPRDNKSKVINIVQNMDPFGIKTPLK